MTNLPITPQQADREAYQRLHSNYGPLVEKMLFVDKVFDFDFDMQILAHHAQQACLEERERCERIVRKVWNQTDDQAAFIVCDNLLQAIHEGEAE